MLCSVMSWSVMKSLKKNQKCKLYDISGDNCFHLHSHAINSYWFWELQNSCVTGDNPLHSLMNYNALCSLQFLHIWITGYWLLIKVYLGVQNKCFPFLLELWCWHWQQLIPDRWWQASYDMDCLAFLFMNHWNNNVLK